MFESDPQFETPYFPTVPTLYAQWASRYIWEHGITAEQAAQVAVEHRKWALTHPWAAMRTKGEITVQDVLQSRMISTPLRKLDCAPWYPGGVGIGLVVTSAERARDLTDKPVFVEGFGEFTTHEFISDRMNLSGVMTAEDGPNLSVSGLKVAADDAYRMAGWSASDLDFVETQAPFSYLILKVLEEIGLCGVGEAGKFVERGGISFESGLPVNTSGGLLSFGQPINANPLLLEALQQLRGEAPGRQVENASKALVHFHGGTYSAHAVALLSN
jgi:acetyl-CoA acetyltransferase